MTSPWHLFISLSSSSTAPLYSPVIPPLFLNRGEELRQQTSFLCTSTRTLAYFSDFCTVCFLSATRGAIRGELRNTAVALLLDLRLNGDTKWWRCRCIFVGRIHRLYASNLLESQRVYRVTCYESGLRESVLDTFFQRHQLEQSLVGMRKECLDRQREDALTKGVSRHQSLHCICPRAMSPALHPGSGSD